MSETPQEPLGKLAAESGEPLPLQGCESASGFYLGTVTREGLPYTRESAEYWRRRADAEKALKKGGWTQRDPL